MVVVPAPRPAGRPACVVADLDALVFDRVPAVGEALARLLVARIVSALSLALKPAPSGVAAAVRVSCDALHVGEQKVVPMKAMGDRMPLTAHSVH